jgi:hypothetical protein
MKLAIIVPYRDRRDDLDVFIPHMEKFLANKQIDYKIFVAEQSDQLIQRLLHPAINLPQHCCFW